MLLLGHVGYTVGGGWLAQRLRLKNPADFRLLALMAISPDIIDRALYALLLPDAQSGRLIAHTLVFQLALLVALVALRRGLWIYGLASLLHLALDGVGLPAQQALWPALGPGLENVGIVGSEAAAGQPYGQWALDRLRDTVDTYGHAGPAAVLWDMGGLAVLVAFAVRARLYERDRLLLLLRRGKVL